MGFIALNTRPDNIKTCPLCGGTGYNDTMQNQSGATRTAFNRGPHIPLCRLCKGGKVVNLDRVCECGGPAVCQDYESKLWFCGRPECLGAAKFRAGRAKHLAEAL